MSPTECAALAILGNRDRRLLAALLRVLRGAATADDFDALPPREAGEPVVRWACRCRRVGDPVAAAASLESEAGSQLARGLRIGARAIPFFHADYPTALGTIADPPAVLWLRAQKSALHARAVALVGSRAASAYGLAMAKRLATDLAAAGVVVVSGLARGVDSAAHAACVAAGGRTVGVLGCGIDRIYPAEHRDLAHDMLHLGAIVSEFPPGVPPLRHHFPLRNRIISGLSAAVVVVEAPEKSGSLITASAASEQGRDVMVVPGSAVGGRNRGGHLLLRDGAIPVESAADVLAELGWQSAAGPGDARTAGDSSEVIDFTVDEVAEQTGKPASAVLADLLELELTGRIQRVGGGRFVRVSRTPFAPEPSRTGAAAAVPASPGPVLP
jgi:DNA processing protein